VSTKIKVQQKVNDTQIFVDEIETQLRARYKTVTLTCIDAVVVH